MPDTVNKIGSPRAHSCAAFERTDMTRPAPDELPLRTLSATLERAAVERPDHPAVVDEDGHSLTYAELLDGARRVASGLLARGLQPGDRVVLMMDNHAAHVVTWAATSFAGLVAVPVNSAFQGGMLSQVLDDAAPRAVVCDAAHLGALRDAGAVDRAHLVVVHDQPANLAHGLVSLADLAVDTAALPSPRGRDLLQILFTSGTTGRSKGVMMTQAHLFAFSDPATVGAPTSDDRMLVCLPLFHVAGQWSLYSAWRAGATAVVRRRFSASAFWRQADELGCTTTLLLGAMADFLMKQKPADTDGRTSLTRIWMVPVIPEVRAFERRFGVQVATYYGSTEAGNVLNAGFGATVPSGCGWPRDGVEVRLVDDQDEPVAPGEVGELVLRTREPWELMLGYLDRPDATEEALRNGWFHSGDLFRELDDGQLAFVDRVKDSLRRRGENVSSYEVEREAMALDGVLEAAVVGVPSEHTEDEIYLTAVVAAGGPDEATLWEHLAGRLPYFMVPRYVELLDSLPRTATQKIGKAELRGRGVAGAWDCEAAGLSVGREGVRRSPATA